jgi:hypothetical protein
LGVKNLKPILSVLLVFVFSLAISSPQLIPAFEAYRLSARSTIDVKFVFDLLLMKPRHLITFIAPDFWGNPGAFNYFQTGFYHEKVIFLGIPGLLFFLYSFLIKGKNKVIHFFQWFSLIILGLGFSPLGWLIFYLKLPLLSAMAPSRIFFLSAFGLSVLSAFGIEDWQNKNINFRKWKIILFGIGLVIIILWGFTLCHKYFLSGDLYGSVSLRNLFLPSLVFLLTSLLILTKERFRKFAFWGLIFVSVISSIYFANKIIYFSERRFVFPEVPVIKKLKEISGINRVWGYGLAYFERNMNSYFGLYAPGGYEAVFPALYGGLLYSSKYNGKLTSYIDRSDVEIIQAEENEEILDNWYRKRLLSLLGVKYVIEAKIGPGKEIVSTEKRFPNEYFVLLWEDESFRIWEYKEALPRFFLADDFVIEKNKQKIVDYLFDKNFDLGKKVVIEEEPKIKIEKNTNQTGKTEIVNYSPNFIELKVETEKPQLLFLSDNYYPGWQVYIDGKQDKIYRADYTFRAVAVPAGRHQVIFSFEPKSFYWGLKISLISLVLFIISLRFVKIKENRQR